MADILDSLGERLQGLLGAPQSVVSAAPGGGPEADREGERTKHSGRIGKHVPRGHDALGYGGHGDAVAVVDPDAQVSEAVRRYVHQAQQKGLHQVKPAGKIRLAQPFSPEAHIGGTFQFTSGPYSLFDGTLSAPAGGNSTQTIAVTLPQNIPSPVMLLDRYPGALYMSVFVRSFSFMPTAALMTGVQECWFTDPGGAIAALGVYNPANPGSAIYQNIGALCTTPLTDPGNTQIGTITVTNVGIGGTPCSVRWQMGVCYVAFYPDPWFNEQVVIPPTPAQLAEYLRTSGAQGN